jgi:hypothetical protein
MYQKHVWNINKQPCSKDGVAMVQYPLRSPNVHAEGCNSKFEEIRGISKQMANR